MELLEAYEKLKSLCPNYKFTYDGTDEDALVEFLMIFLSENILGAPNDYHIHNAIFKLLKLRRHVDTEFPNDKGAIKDLYKSLRMNPYVDIDAGFLKIAFAYLADKGIVAYKTSIDWWWITDLGNVYLTVLERWFHIQCNKH